MSRRNNPYLFFVALVLGVVMAVGGSVWATSVGTNVSVTGNLTVSSTSASSSVTYALGVGTSTPAKMFSVGGAGGTNTGHGYFTGGLGVGNVSTTTVGGIETSGAALLGGVLNVTGATTLNTTAVITTSLGIATTSPATTLSIVGSTYTTLGLGAGRATTTAGAIENSGNALFGDAAGDRVMFNAANLIHNNAGTTTLPASATAWSYATSSAGAFVRLDTTNTRVGIASSSPGAALAVAGDGTAIIMSGEGTSTISVQSGGTTKGGCIELESAAGDGSVFRLYATTTGLVVFESGSCR